MKVDLMLFFPFVALLIGFAGLVLLVIFVIRKKGTKSRGTTAKKKQVQSPRDCKHLGYSKHAHDVCPTCGTYLPPEDRPAA